MEIDSDKLERCVLPSTAPHEIRDAVVSDIMARTGAQAGNWYTICRDPSADVVLLGENRFQGPPAVTAALRAAEGQPVAPVFFGEQKAEFSMITRVNQFEIQTAAELPTALVEQMWDPGDLHCSIGFNAMIDDRYGGWVGAFRTRPHDVFEPGLPARMKPHVEGYLRLLGAARIIDATHPGKNALLVVRKSGTLIAHSPGAAAWLESSEFEARIVTEARNLLDSDRDGTTLMLGYAEVRVLRLDGEAEPACAILVTPREETDFTRLFSLSKRQREVINFAVESLTVSEIADAMELSHETVKTHLKEIYDRLDITSRTELTGICARVGHG